MKKNNGSFSSDRMDRALVAFSLLGILFCAALLTSETVYKFFLGHSSRNSNAQVIGEISFATNDIRHRSAEALSWEKAKSEQRIRIGDSVFTGEKSQSQVMLKDGGRVDLDQNSLVKFTKIDNIELPNLALGNFRVAVNGTMKIAIGGEVTEISGHGTEVQIFFTDKQKPRLRLLKGAAQVKTKTSTKTLATNQITALREPVVEPKKESTPVESKVLPQFRDERLFYTDQLYDHFESRSGTLKRRERRRQVVNFPVDVSWTTSGKVTKVFGQLSANADFSNIPESFTESAARGTAKFPRSLIGENFYRLSLDGKSWSSPASFQVTAKPLEKSAPILKFKSTTLVILENVVEAQGTINGDFPNFVVELSHSPDFPANESRVLWLKNKKFEFPITQAKNIFARIRGVDEKQNLTDTSSPVQLSIKKPELPHAPLLAQKELVLLEGDEVNLPWMPAPRAKQYQVRIVSENGRTVTRHRTAETSMPFTTSTPGTYKLQVTTEDMYGRISKKSSEMRLVVRRKPAPVIAKEDQPKRTPTSTATLTEQMRLEIPDYLNRNYPSSKLTVEGAAFTMISQDQVAQGGSDPTALMLGIRWQQWFASQGIETSLKSKAVDLSSSPGGNVAPLQLEARYHYRWALPFNPFSKFDQSQISVIGGYEYYRNPSHGLFSPGYDLFKVGFSLAFPLWNRWDTGGEVLYGQGLESSSKYEVSGYIHYYLKRNWSLGFGYRVHLFQAGSDGASPLGLPYREGFGEGYSALRWHY